MSTIAGFLAEHGYTASFTLTENPRDWGGHAYVVTFHRTSPAYVDRADPIGLGSKLGPVVYTDSAHNAEEGRSPNLADVVDCLLSDYGTAQDANTPGELAREFGIEDVDEAIETYNAVKASAERTEAIFGDLLPALLDCERP